MGPMFDNKTAGRMLLDNHFGRVTSSCHRNPAIVNCTEYLFGLISTSAMEEQEIKR
jgi:hypothetical protein